MKAMESGVAWFGIAGANAKPGQVGNSVLSGHSSNDILEGGSYKFIFAKLDQLASGRPHSTPPCFRTPYAAVRVASSALRPDLRSQKRAGS